MSNKKHPPPLRCHIRRALFGVSPSALCARCGLGVKHKSKKCKGCTKNVSELIYEGFQEGLLKGRENPTIYEQLRDMAIGHIEEEQRPELTHEVKAEDLPACDTSLYKDFMVTREVKLDKNGNIILLPPKK